MSVARFLPAFGLLLVVSPASGEWKSEYGQANPERPDAQKRLNVPFKSCCDNGDVFKTRFRVGSANEDQWEYLDGDTWKIIPADIISNEPSLDNTPILFKNRADGKELCFFKPQGGI